MTEPRQLVYTAQLSIRWRDLDAFNHVNSSEYFTYLEQARILWWQQVGMPVNAAGGGPAVITAECTYLKQITYPAELIINVYASPPSRSSYIIYYEVALKDSPQVLHAIGSTKIVWVDYKVGKSMPLPDSVKAHLPLN